MATKTLSADEEAYHALARAKRYRSEFFSHAVICVNLTLFHPLF